MMNHILSFKRLFPVALLCGALLAGPSVALADAPARIPVQGVLTDADDLPVDGTLPVIFTLYADAAGTVELWSGTQSVLFARGFFSTYLGADTPLDLATFRDNGVVHLGVAVDGDDEMPLVEVATAPFAGFAQYAGDAGTLGGMAPTDFVAVADGLDWADITGKPDDLSVTPIADGGLESNAGAIGLSTACVTGEILKRTDTGWACAADDGPDATDELITAAALNGTSLELTEGGVLTTVDLSSLQDGVDDADADPANEIQDIALSGTSLSITNGSTVDLAGLQDGVDDADADPANEIQDIALSGTSLSITSGSTVDLAGLQDGVNDADADPANEIQDIALNGTDLSISSGSTVDLSALQDGVDDADADPANEIQDIALNGTDLSISGGSTVDLSGLAGSTGVGNSSDVTNSGIAGGQANTITSSATALSLTPTALDSTGSIWEDADTTNDTPWTEGLWNCAVEGSTCYPGATGVSSTTLTAVTATAAGGNFIGGGTDNTITDSASAFIGGGTGNSIDTGGNGSSIGGGAGNAVGSGDAGATIAGGVGNRADDDYATVGGGRGNTAEALYTTVAGGWNNAARDSYTTIGGGRQNFIRNGDYGVISGGQNNQIHQPWATIGGGGGNLAANWYCTVGGGDRNMCAGDSSTVTGGWGNRAMGIGSTVAGGRGNRALGSYSTIGGGRNNQAGNQYSYAAGRFAFASHDGAWVWADSVNIKRESTAANQFMARASGGYVFYSNSASTTGAELPANAGAWTSLSDRNSKENIIEVDPVTVLLQLVDLPIAIWNWKSEGPAVPHMGPMAQDFFEAFGLGDDDTRISTVDPDGVALAAIQGLFQLLTDKDSKIKALEAKVKAQASRLEALDARFNRLEAQLQRRSR